MSFLTFFFIFYSCRREKTDAPFAQVLINVHQLPLVDVKSPIFLLYSASVRQGIVDSVKRALGDQKVKSVVICGQNGVFCGGMDGCNSKIETAN